MYCSCRCGGWNWPSTHVRCALMRTSVAVGFGASQCNSERCRLGYASRLPKCAERVPSTLPGVRSYCHSSRGVVGACSLGHRSPYSGPVRRSGYVRQPGSLHFFERSSGWIQVVVAIQSDGRGSWWVFGTVRRRCMRSVPRCGRRRGRRRRGVRIGSSSGMRLPLGP